MTQQKLTINPRTREVLVGEEPAYLSPREFDLLLELVDHSDRIVSSKELLIKFWGSESDGNEHSLHVTVNRLRNRLKDSGKKQVWIKTRLSFGYYIDQNTLVEILAPRQRNRVTYREVYE